MSDETFDETMDALDLPWKGGRPAAPVALSGVYREWGIEDASGRSLFCLRALSGSDQEPIQAARAKYVLRAVNAFGPMRERLRSARQALEEARKGRDLLRSQGLATSALDDVLAALRAADETTEGR